MKSDTLKPNSGAVSQLAQKLLAFLRATGGAHETTCAEHLFDKPQYDRAPNAQRAFWQWEANLHGVKLERPVGDTFESFSGPEQYGDSYTAQTSAAYQELRAAGLADELNNGFASYTFIPTRIGKEGK